MTKTARSMTLADGSTIVIRLIQADDRDLLARMFDRLSHHARRARFRGRIESLTEEDLDYLTDVDQYRHDALVAVESQAHDAVGVARYVRLPGRPELAEVAVEVVEEWQGRGVATALLVELTERARSAGVERYSAIVSRENRLMAELLDRLGAELLREDDDEVEYEIDLAGSGVATRLAR